MQRQIGPTVQARMNVYDRSSPNVVSLSADAVGLTDKCVRRHRPHSAISPCQLRHSVAFTTIGQITHFANRSRAWHPGERLLSCRVTAPNIDRLTRDIARLVRGKERNNVSDIGGQAGAPERNLCDLGVT